jgi:hypothetical protein
LIILQAELTGPSGSGILQLALDAGATTTLINVAMLVGFAPRVELQRLTALGLERFGLQVLGHTLPPSSEVDGLLGLDLPTKTEY